MANSVYVSYSWSAEDDSHIVEKLKKAWQDRGIEFVELKIDKQAINYGDSIRAFMDELTKADSVILVLSEAYFKSPNCMYELRGISANKNFQERVSPIVLRGTPLYDPLVWVELLAYWENKEAGLDAKLKTIRGTNVESIQKTLNDYADFRRLLAGQLAMLADMNALTQDIHVDTDFEDLLNRIQPKKTKTPFPLERYRKPDAEFLRMVRSEIKRILVGRINLEKALLAEVNVELSDKTGDLVEDICTADFDVAITRILRPATKSCLSGLPANSADWKNTWEDAKSLLAWLSLLLVSPDWIAQQENRGRVPGFSFEIMVKTPSAVEIVSCRYRQMQPKLRAEPGKNEVKGRGRIEHPKWETGWSDGRSDEPELNKLLLEIWLCIFPESKRSSLSADDIEDLNEALKLFEETKDSHYYVPVEEGDDCPLGRQDFREKLLDKLPAITLISIKTASGPPLLVISERRVMAVIRQFLTMGNLE